VVGEWVAGERVAAGWVAGERAVGLSGRWVLPAFVHQGGKYSLKEKQGLVRSQAST
jgi:hypothetical protein